MFVGATDLQQNLLHRLNQNFFRCSHYCLDLIKSSFQWHTYLSTIYSWPCTFRRSSDLILLHGPSFFQKFSVRFLENRFPRNAYLDSSKNFRVQVHKTNVLPFEIPKPAHYTSLSTGNQQHKQRAAFDAVFKVSANKFRCLGCTTYSTNNFLALTSHLEFTHVIKFTELF